MLPAAGAVPSGPHPVKAPEIQPDQLLKVHAPATSLGTCSASGMQPGATSGHSSKSSAENFSLPLAQGAPSKNISCLDAGLPEGQDDFSDMSDSSATITYMDASVNSSDDSDKGSVVLPPKRCRGSKRSRMPLSSTPVENMPRPNLTVIFKPQNPEQIITRFNPLTLKAAFEAVVPDGVLQVRPNERLNLLAVDTRSAEVSERLLKIKNIGEIALQAYEPRPNNCGVGVIKGVPTDLDQQDIFSALLQRAPVKSVRRLGASENVRIVFATESAPEHVILGYTRYRVYKYIESPRQCSKCQRFGHVAGTCRLQARCSRCGGNHERSSCGTEEPQCPNCKKKHESTSPRCRVLRKEKEIHNYKKNNNVGYSSAKAVVCKQRNASSRHSGEKTPVNNTSASEKAFETTPRIDDTDEFPSLPPRPTAQTSILTTTAAAAPINVPTVGVQQSTAGPSTRPRSSYPWSGPRERSTRQGNETTFSLLSALVDAARSFLAPMSSLVAKAILTLLDLILPILEKWR
ncbi:hypothetical protein HPB52_015278 [Rhipicephalus sanguineus]|uniref:Tick transposon n=1 Tax=Rhipicephalus sanguineus TaxID=34632 RepID=A0A9D4QAB8_RHISA|nr:hypothetical protein HPB52_015278 [Rhipicephalus sanguineus]